MRELSSNLSKYISRFPNSHSVTRFDQKIDPQIVSGETPAQAIERRRRRIWELQSALNAVRTAPYPAAEAKRLMRDEIKKLAESGRPSVSDLIARRGKIIWPKMSVRGDISTEKLDRGFATIESIDSNAVSVWLHHDQLVRVLDAEIDASADDRNALTDEQRRQRYAEIAAEILSTEREEEALITHLETQGTALLRRVEADPRAVLGLASDMPAPITQ